MPLITALPQSASDPVLHIAKIDCDLDEVLCTAWVANMPSVYHFLIPRQSDPQAKTPLHIVDLNHTAVTATEIVNIKSQKSYLNKEEYTGALHPIDGWLRKFNILTPMGYVLWGFGTIPSWMMMIGISFLSRQFMSKRVGNRGGLGAGDIVPPQGPTAQQPRAAAGPASPAGAGRAGGKKRR